MKYRVYWNDVAAPSWSIDQGTPETEICVQRVFMSGLQTWFQTDPTAEKVKAWAEVHGQLEVRDGIAYLSPVP